MITDMDKSNADKDSYSRKLTDSERERMDKLREQYENEGRFPEGKVAVVDKEEDAKEGQITFVTTTRTYVIPEKEMTDEQILQIIDYGYKEDYSLRQERRGTEENYDGVVSDEQVAENEEKIKSCDGMSKEEAKELAAKYIKNIYDIDVSEYDVDVNANYDSSYEVHFQKDNSIIVNIDAVNKQLEYIHIDEYEVENNNEKADENLFTNYASTVKEIIVNKANLAETDSKYHYEYTLTEDEKVQAGIMSYYFEKSNGKVVQIRVNCKEQKIIDVAIYTEKQYKTMNKTREKQYKELGLKRVSVEMNVDKTNVVDKTVNIKQMKFTEKQKAKAAFVKSSMSFAKSCKEIDGLYNNSEYIVEGEVENAYDPVNDYECIFKSEGKNYIRNFPADEKIAKYSTQNVIKNNVSLSSAELEKYCITMNK